MARATEGTRYTILTPDNQSANIWVITVISICFTTAAILARGISKAIAGLKYTVDDYTILGAYALGIIQYSLTIKALTLGLGKDANLLNHQDIKPMEDYFIAGVTFAMLSVYTVKVSMVLLIQRLFNYPLMYVWIGMIVLGVTSTITVAGGCTYPSCSHPLPRWIVSTAFDILTELIIITLPIFCIRRIQMESYSKIKVQASFFSRLLVIVFAILTIWSLGRIELTSTPSSSVFLPTVFAQTELCISIAIAAILPCFRLLFQSSERELNDSSGYPRQESKPQDSFGMDSVGVASTVAPLPRKPEHSAASSQDMGGALTNSTGPRMSESSVTPSANTNLSQRPFVQ